MLGQVVAGSAVITLGWDADQLFGDLEKILDETKSIIRKAGIAAAATGAGITAALSLAAAKAEADAVKFRSIEAALGDSTSQAVELATAIANEVGQSVNAVTKEIAAFTMAATQIGFAKQQAIEMGAAVSRMADDFNTFFGRTDGFERLTQAIQGSTDALREFGIDLSDAAVSEFLGKPIEQATELQKQYARTQLAAQAFQEQQISGAASSDSYQASVGRLASSFADLTTAIGEAFGPIYRVGREVASMANEAMAAAVRQVTELTRSFPVMTQLAGLGAMAIAGVGAAVTLATSSLVSFAATHYVTSKAIQYSLAVTRDWTVTQYAAATASKVASVASGILSAAISAVAVATNAVLAPLYAMGLSFGAIVAGAAALGAGLYYLEKTTGIFTSALEQLGLEGLNLQSIWDGIAEAIAGAWKWLKQFLSGIGQAVGISIPGLTGDQKTAATEQEKRESALALEGLKSPEEKYNEYVAQLETWLEKKLIDERQLAELEAKARKERDEAIKRQFDQTAEGRHFNAMAALGERIREEAMSVEEKLAAKIAEINQAVAQDPTLRDAADKVIANLREEEEKRIQAAQDAVRQAEERLRNEQERSIREVHSRRDTILSALSDDKAPFAKFANQQAMIEELKSQGFSTVDDEIALNSEILRTANQTIAAAQPPAEAMVTRSATEAMFGLSLGAKIDEQQLEELTRAREAQEAARDALERLLQEMEG